MGVTLVGQYDQVVTPFRTVEAGIFAHAAMLSSILSGRFLYRGSGARLAELMFLLGTGLLLGAVLPRAAPWLKARAPAGPRPGRWLVLVQLALRQGVVLASALPLANVFLAAFAVVFVGYLSTDREKARLRRTFRYYVGDSVMTEMLDAPRAAPAGRARSATAPCSSATSAASPPSARAWRPRRWCASSTATSRR